MTLKLADVVAANARRLRCAGQSTLDDVAQAARGYGTAWDTSKISLLERGKVAPTVPNLIIAALALSDATGTRVTVEDLTATADPIAISDTLSVNAEELHRVLRGEASIEPLPQTGQTTSLAVQRLARRLGMPATLVATESRNLWGCSFDTERNRIAGPGASKQRRAAVTKMLDSELREAIATRPLTD